MLITSSHVPLHLLCVTSAQISIMWPLWVHTRTMSQIITCRNCCHDNNGISHNIYTWSIIHQMTSAFLRMKAFAWYLTKNNYIFLSFYHFVNLYFYVSFSILFLNSSSSVTLYIGLSPSFYDISLSKFISKQKNPNDASLSQITYKFTSFFENSIFCFEFYALAREYIADRLEALDI